MHTSGIKRIINRMHIIFFLLYSQFSIASIPKHMYYCSFLWYSYHCSICTSVIRLAVIRLAACMGLRAVRLTTNPNMPVVRTINKPTYPIKRTQTYTIIVMHVCIA